MGSGNRATATICLACAAALCGGPSSAAEATVQWHPVSIDSPPTTAFALNPANPTTTNVISFVAPTDGQIYINGCYAALSNGNPAIAVAATNQTITVSFSAPLTNVACPQIVAPVSGVDGQFGPLSAGTWVFDILQNAYSFSVAEAPLPLPIQTVRWHPVTNGSPPTTVFSLNPSNPTTTNVISFVAPTDGQIYVNECYASFDNGTPAIAVEITPRAIAMSFSAPLTNVFCPAIVAPVSGVDGQFGPLSAGTWVFDILQNAYSFSVTEAPLPLSIQTVTNSSAFQLGWPVSGDAFVLEFNDGLAPGNWQVVTNPPTTASNLNTLLINVDSGSRFFRLRRLPP
jgi:hypothetical protein